MRYCSTLATLGVVLSAGLFLIQAKPRPDKAEAFMLTPMPLQLPQGWPIPEGDIFKDNKPTLEAFLLGRKLFYDGNLSSDSITSCGSCHQQFAAFSSFDHDLSHGVTNTLTTRNAPALFNLAWMSSFHWDGGVANIEAQPLNPLTAPNEMGETLENVLRKINADLTYEPYYKKAFGDGKATSARTLKALAQFVGQLISSNSKYDKVKAGKDSFSKFEAAGYEMFKLHCNSCHAEPLFTSNDYSNTGLTKNRFEDVGRMGVTGKPADSLVFKIPSLRNVQLTYPYAHDGRFYSVEDVINHYMNIDTSRTDIDARLRKKIQMTPLQKNQLIYFLYTLTDTSFTKNKLFAPDIPVQFKH